MAAGHSGGGATGLTPPRWRLTRPYLYTSPQAPPTASRRRYLRAVFWPLAGMGWPLMACAHAQASSAVPPEVLKPPYQLPEAGSSVVLRWDSLGGMLPTPPGPPEPALLLHADGRFSAHASAASAPRRRTGQLAPAALQALLAELLVTQGFALLDGAAMRAQMAAISQRTGRFFQVMDGGVTRITLTLPAVQHTVEMPALHAAVRVYPEIQALRQLHAVQQRLLALAETAG